MNTAIFSQFIKTRVGAERIIFSVLKDEPAFIHENTGVKHPVGDFRNDLHVIWWISENNIIPVLTVSDEFHGIGTKDPDIFHVKGSEAAIKEPCGFRIDFHHIHSFGAARGKFKTNASCSGKQVKHCKPVKIIDICKNIE